MPAAATTLTFMVKRFQMIFVDTGIWFAMAVPTDQDHALVSTCLSRLGEPLLTTDYVVDETLTLLRARGYERRAMALGEQFFAGSVAEIYYLAEENVRAAWDIYSKFDDKKWSFTD